MKINILTATDTFLLINDYRKTKIFISNLYYTYCCTFECMYNNINQGWRTIGTRAIDGMEQNILSVCNVSSIAGS